MKRIVLLLVIGTSTMLIVPTPPSALAAEGESFKSSGTFTLEVPKLGYLLICKESGSGKVGVSAELKMTSCVLEGWGKCTVEPFVIHLDGSYNSGLFVMVTTGACFWFETVDWVSVHFKVESFKEEKGVAKVQLFGATSFMGDSASMSLASTWIF